MALAVTDLLEEIKKAEETAQKSNNEVEVLKVIVKLLTLNLKLLNSIRGNQVKYMRSQGIQVGKRETANKEEKK